MGGNGSSSSLWPTPNAGLHNDGEDPESFQARLKVLKEKHRNGNGAGTPLAMAVKLWQTPSVADTTGGRMTRSGDRSGEMLLKGQAVAFSLQDPTTETPGLPSSTQPRTSRPQLNPIFVEWLMGWPIGWTAFGCSETGWFRYRQRTRTALSSLASPSAALPPQLSLFG